MANGCVISHEHDPLPSAGWGGLNQQPLGDKHLRPRDMELFHEVDDPNLVVDIIKCYFERMGHSLGEGRDTP